MRTLPGVAKDIASIIRAGGLSPAEDFTLYATSDPAEAVTSADRRDIACLIYFPRIGRGEVRTCPGGIWLDRLTFFADLPADAQPDDDTHTAALTRVRAELADFAAAEFGPVPAGVEL